MNDQPLQVVVGANTPDYSLSLYFYWSALRGLGFLQPKDGPPADRFKKKTCGVCHVSTAPSNLNLAFIRLAWLSVRWFRLGIIYNHPGVDVKSNWTTFRTRKFAMSLALPIRHQRELMTFSVLSASLRFKGSSYGRWSLADTISLQSCPPTWICYRVCLQKFGCFSK